MYLISPTIFSPGADAVKFRRSRSRIGPLQGEFNRSSQHLDRVGGCCGARQGACGDFGWSAAASVTWPAAGQSA
jgi:hypothetical protein